MRILSTSDLQIKTKWESLSNVCDTVKPNIVCIAGDLFPIQHNIKKEGDFIKDILKCLRELRNLDIKVVLVPGNDDNTYLNKEIDEWQSNGFCCNVSDRVCEIDGLEFAGCGWVPDLPFSYKGWVRKEMDDFARICDETVCNCIVIDEKNHTKFISSSVDKNENNRVFGEYLDKLPSIYSILNSTAEKVKNINKSIWLMHAPPRDLMLDVCFGNRKVGSYAITKFIEEKRPFITLHGHIHESPEVTGIWCGKIGETYCIQAGQPYNTFNYALIDIQDGNIVGLKHSSLGVSHYLRSI